MLLAGDNEREAKRFALWASQKNPGSYVTLYAAFGIYCSIKKNMNVYEPTDSLFGVYWLNGKEKLFTKKQRIADQNATPALS